MTSIENLNNDGLNSISGPPYVGVIPRLLTLNLQMDARCIRASHTDLSTINAFNMSLIPFAVSIVTGIGNILPA